MPLRISENSNYVNQMIDDLLMISQSPSLIIDKYVDFITDPDTGENQVIRGTGYIYFENNDPLESSVGTNMLQQIINSHIDVLIRAVSPDYQIPNLSGQVLSLQCSAYTLWQPMIQRDFYTWLEIFYVPVRSLSLMYKTVDNEFEPVRSNMELFHELAHVKVYLDGVTTGLDSMAANIASHNAAIRLTNEYRAALPDHPPARALSDPINGDEWICGDQTLEEVTGTDESDPDLSDPLDPDNQGETIWSPPTGYCFVATAVYGTPAHKDVMILREFRERVLIKTASGRFIVHLYYRIGPAIANAIKPHPSLRTIIRYILKPVI